MFTVSTLVTLFVVLCIVGVLLWGINQIPGIPDIVKVVVYVFVAIGCLLWILNAFGGVGGHGVLVR